MPVLVVQERLQTAGENAVPDAPWGDTTLAMIVLIAYPALPKTATGMTVQFDTSLPPPTSISHDCTA